MWKGYVFVKFSNRTLQVLAFQRVFTNSLLERRKPAFFFKPKVKTTVNLSHTDTTQNENVCQFLTFYIKFKLFNVIAKNTSEKVAFDFFAEEQHMMSSLSNSRSGIRIIRAYVVLLGRRHMLFFKQANFTVIKAYYNFCGITAASSQGRKHVNSLQHCFRGHWQGSSLETSPLFLQLADTPIQRGCKNHIVSSSIV